MEEGGATSRPAADDSIFIVRGLEGASRLAADLFQEVFGGAPPAEPLHYVAFEHLSPGRFAVAGYYHVTYRDDYALVGGLCVAPAYRGRRVGERLERAAFAEPRGAKAFFAHVGDPRRANRLGFEDTRHPHLVVFWVRPLSPEEGERLIDTVAALGPF